MTIVWTRDEKIYLIRGVIQFNQDFQSILNTYPNQFSGRTRGSLVKKWYIMNKLEDPLLHDENLIHDLFNSILQENPSLSKKDLMHPKEWAVIKQQNTKNVATTSKSKKRKSNGSLLGKSTVSNQQTHRDSQDIQSSGSIQFYDNQGDNNIRDQNVDSNYSDRIWNENQTLSTENRNETNRVSNFKQDELNGWERDTGLDTRIRSMLKEGITPLDIVYSTAQRYAPNLSSVENISHVQYSQVFDQIFSQYQKYYLGKLNNSNIGRDTLNHNQIGVQAQVNLPSQIWKDKMLDSTTFSTTAFISQVRNPKWYHLHNIISTVDLNVEKNDSANFRTTDHKNINQESPDKSGQSSLESTYLEPMNKSETGEQSDIWPSNVPSKKSSLGKKKKRSNDDNEAKRPRKSRKLFEDPDAIAKFSCADGDLLVKKQVSIIGRESQIYPVDIIVTQFDKEKEAKTALSRKQAILTVIREDSKKVQFLLENTGKFPIIVISTVKGSPNVHKCKTGDTVILHHKDEVIFPVRRTFVFMINRAKVQELHSSGSSSIFKES